MQSCLPEVQVCLHDDGSEPMMYDLDLRWPDGRVDALEVTKATSASMRQLFARLRRQGMIAATECARSWVVPLATYDTDVRAVRARIDHMLSLVEQAGLTSFGERDERRSLAVARVRRLGVDGAYSYPPKDGEPTIRLELPVRAWWQQPEAVSAVVEDHAARNAEKLIRSGPGRAPPICSIRLRGGGSLECDAGRRTARGVSTAARGSHHRLGDHEASRR